YLWLSTDERAQAWEEIDIVSHHNRWAPDSTYRIDFRSGEGKDGQDKSTAYTEIIEVAPNHLLMIYDRMAFGWKSTPADSGEFNRIFVLPIEVERDQERK